MPPARRPLPAALACALLAACGGGRGRPEAAPSPARGLCSGDGFCWLEPAPFGSSLSAVAWAGGEAWAAGPRGAVLRLAGGAWSAEPTGAPWAARAVWAGPGGEVLVAGDALLRREGSRFVEAHRPPAGAAYRALHGSGPAHVWAVGTGGLASRFDGARWEDLPVEGEPGELGAVFALADGTAFAAVRDGGRVHRFANGRWTRIGARDGGGALRLDHAEALWAASPEDVWVAGLTGTGKEPGLPNLFRWDGERWTPHPLPALDRTPLLALGGAGPEDLWVLGRALGRENAAHWDGRRWTPVRIADGLRALSIGPDGEGLAVGDRGAVARLSGGAWTTLLPGADRFADEADARAGVAWIASAQGPGPSRLLRVDARGAAEVALPAGDPHVDGLSVAPDGAPWVILGQTFARWDGAAWAEHPSGALGGLHGLHAVEPSLVWLTGDGLAGRWDGQAFTAHPLPSGLWEIRATGPDEAWAVGGFLEPHRFDGAAWAPAPLGVDRLLYDLWSSGPDDVWVVGGHGLAARFDGVAWRVLDAGTDVDLTAVTGDGRGRVWVTRGDGGVLEWDGGAFRALETGSVGWLSVAAWDDALGLLVGGEEGVLLRSP